MEKASLYELLFFQVAIVTLKKKDALKKIQCRSKLVLCITRIALREQE